MRWYGWVMFWCGYAVLQLAPFVPVGTWGSTEATYLRGTISAAGWMIAGAIFVTQPKEKR